MIVCPACAAENEVEAAFCGSCGTTLALAAVEPATESAAGGAAADGAAMADGAMMADGAASTGRVPVDDDAVVPGTKTHRIADLTDATVPTIQVRDVHVTAATPEPVGITCPVCGTLNHPSRSFCSRCAGALRAPDPTPKTPINAGFIARFAISAMVSMAIVVVGATLLLRPTGAGAAPGSTPAPTAISVSLVDELDHDIDFDLIPNAEEPTPIGPLPAESTVQLATYKAPTAAAPLSSKDRAPWWNNGLPRVPAVSQFDGGPFQKVNCMLASAAMLARLGYGVVTTGSQLRALTSDREGGVSFRDLQGALQRGWGARVSIGSASIVQFRALMYAGAGAVIAVVYGDIPVGTRLQESFTGNHAIYIDAFRPDGPNGPEYYVMDPIGHSWAGYKGEWWPAAMVERAAVHFGGGAITAAWAFAGGKIPADHPILPETAYPPGTPPQSPAPGASGEGGQGEPDLVPPGDLPLDNDGDDVTPPPDGPRFPDYDVSRGGFLLTLGGGSLKCAQIPRPAGCPTGIVGVFDPSGVVPPTTSNGIKLLYADAIAPNTYQIIFDPPLGSDGSLLLWGAGGGELKQASVEEGLLKGASVSIATVILDPNQTYSFVATSQGDGISSISDVGTLKVSP